MESNVWTSNKEFGPVRTAAQPGLDELCISKFSTKMAMATLAVTARRFP